MCVRGCWSTICTRRGPGVTALPRLVSFINWGLSLLFYLSVLLTFKINQRPLVLMNPNRELQCFLSRCLPFIAVYWSSLCIKSTCLCGCVCVCLQGMSETFSTLHGLVNKGVNVVMDIPYELWNETSAEVADLKKQVHKADSHDWKASGAVSGLNQIDVVWVILVKSQKPDKPRNCTHSTTLCVCVCACLSVWCIDRAVWGGDWGLVQREPEGRPDYLSVWETCSQRTERRYHKILRS